MSDDPRTVPGPRPLPTRGSMDDLAKAILDNILAQAARTDETNELQERGQLRMSATVTTEMTAVERAEYALRDSIARGTEKEIDRASRRLERAREDEAKRIARAKDKIDAEQKVAQEKREAERIERKAKADDGEAALRAQTPAVVFEACGRRVTVLMSVSGIEMGWSVEAVRRISWSMAKSFSERVVASRNLGSAAPEQDWLSGLMADQSHGIELHIRRGVVRVENI